MKWKLVPEEPTPEMINAGIRADGWACKRYKAMLAAAPVLEGNHKSNVSDMLKGTIAMIEELEKENALLRVEIMRLNNVLQR